MSSPRTSLALRPTAPKTARSAESIPELNHRRRNRNGFDDLDIQEGEALLRPNTSGILKTESHKWRFFPTSYTTDWKPLMIQPKKSPRKDINAPDVDFVRDEVRLEYNPKWTDRICQKQVVEEDATIASRVAMDLRYAHPLPISVDDPSRLSLDKVAPSYAQKLAQLHAEEDATRTQARPLAIDAGDDNVERFTEIASYDAFETSLSTSVNLKVAPSAQTFKSEQARATQNVSPTRREGRVVLLDHTSGYIFDEDSSWFLRFDPRDQVAKFQVSSTVSYNRQHEEEVIAVRLMKVIDANNSRSPMKLGIKRKSMSAKDSLRRKRSSAGLTSMSTFSQFPTASSANTTMSMFVSDDEDPVFPARGLEYYLTFWKAQGIDPLQKLGRNMEKLVELLEAADENEQDESSDDSSEEEGGEVIRSVFDGFGNRAPDEDACWSDANAPRRPQPYGWLWYTDKATWEAQFKREKDSTTGPPAPADHWSNIDGASANRKLRKQSSCLIPTVPPAQPHGATLPVAPTSARAPDTAPVRPSLKPSSTQQSLPDAISSPLSERSSVNFVPRSPRQPTASATGSRVSLADLRKHHSTRVYSVSRAVRRMTLPHGHPLVVKLEENKKRGGNFFH